MLEDLSYSIQAQDRFSPAFDALEQQARLADQQIDRLNDVLNRLEATANRAASSAGNLRAFKDVGSGAVSSLRQLEQELERLSSVRLDVGADQLRQQLEALNQEARKLDAELQGMHFTGGSTGDAVYRARLEDYYTALARQQGDAAAQLARNRGVVGNIGQIYAEHPDDVRPVEEFSQRAYAEVQEKRRFSQEEQRRMLELEAQVYAAKLSEARTERALLEREVAEAEQRTQGVELSEQTLGLFEQADEAYRRLQSESARLAQAEEEAANNLAETKRRLRIDAARQGSIAEADAPAGAVSTRTVISVSAKSADEAERLARALDQVAQARERVAAITKMERESLGQEVDAERQKARIRAESAQMAENLVQLERTAGEKARAAAQQAVEAERGNTQQKRQGVIAAQQALEAERANTHEKRAQVALSNAVNNAARQSVEAERGNTHEKRQAVILAQQQLEIERQRTIQTRQQTREQERQAAEAQRAAMQKERQHIGMGGAGFGGRLADFALGGVTGYFLGQGLEGMLRGGYEMGKVGASNKQLTESFEDLAKSVGLAGDALTDRLSAAVKETVPRVTLMTETNRLLLTAQNEGIKITEQQIETLAKFARLRSTQLTAFGRPLGTEEAFQRLIVGITKRETEILDELGISTKGLAAQMGVPLQEINTSVEGLLTAILKTAQAELDLSGDKALSEAEKIQQAETRIQESMNRLRLASVDPVVFTVNMVANVTEGAVDAFQGMTSSFGGAADAWNRLQNPSTTGIRAQRDAASLRAASAQGGGVIDEEAIRQMELYEDALRRLSQAESLAFEQITRNTSAGPERNAQIRAMTQAIDGLNRAYTDLQARGQAGILDAGQLASAEAQWQAIVAGVQSGSMSTDEADAATQRLLASLRQIPSVFDFVIPQAADFADQMERAATFAAAAGAPALGMTPGQFAVQRYYGNQRTEEIQDGIREEKSADIRQRIEEQLSSTRAVNDAQFQLALAMTDTAGQLALEQARLDQIGKQFGEDSPEYLEARRKVVQVEKQLANETERAGEKFVGTLNRLEGAFLSAIGAIGGIPGFSGRTPVTETDMRLSKLGLYQEKPDEVLRRAEDLLVGRKPRTDISRSFIEQAVSASTGFDMEKLMQIPGDLLFSLFEQEFTSARLFGTQFGQQNLGKLLNQDAIAFGLQQQGQAATGKSFLESQFTSGGLPAIFAQAGGFAGQLDEQLNSSGFANQVGSIFNNQLTSEPVLNGITRAAPAINARLENEILTSAEGSDFGYRLILTYLRQMMRAESEVQ